MASRAHVIGYRIGRTIGVGMGQSAAAKPLEFKRIAISPPRTQILPQVSIHQPKAVHEAPHPSAKR